MPTKKRLYLALAVLGCLGVILILPSCRGLVLGYLRFEPLHKGKPLSYWAARAQQRKMLSGPHDDGSRERKEGFDALVAIGPASVPALVEMIQTNDYWAIRYNAADSLGRLESKAQAAFPVLVQEIKNEEQGRDTRIEMIHAMARINREASLAPFCEALKDEEPSVRAAAAMELEDYRGAQGQQAAAALREASSRGESDKWLREFLPVAVQRIEEEAAGKRGP